MSWPVLLELKANRQGILSSQAIQREYLSTPWPTWFESPIQTQASHSLTSASFVVPEGTTYGSAL